MFMKRKPGSKVKKRYVFIGLAVIISILLYVIDLSIRPALLDQSTVLLREMALKSIDETSNIAMQDIQDVTEFSQVTRDEEGNILLIQSNTLLMNQIAGTTASLTQERLNELCQEGLDIPLGNLLGGQLSSGWGPNIHVNLRPESAVNSSFYTEFESVGINQTLHKAYIRISCEMSVLIGNTSHLVEVSNDILIAENVIIGEVPENFALADTVGDFLNLLP